MLWAAWIVSAIALFVNQFVFDGSGIGPGLSIGVLGLVVQAVMCVFIGRGNATARGLAVVFLVLATLTLQILGRLIAEGAVWSMAYTAGGFALKAAGVFLLFTGGSRKWFA